MTPIVCRHAGARGDIVFALPALKWLSEREGRPVHLQIEAASYTTQRLTPDKFAPLAPLLLAQPYICEVSEYRGGLVDVNMNDFRAKLFPALRRGQCRLRRLTDWQRDVVGAPIECQESPWLSVDPIQREGRIVVNRTPRYQNPKFPWARLMGHLHEDGADVVFLGTQEEHAAFVTIAPWIPWVHTPDLLEAARVIAGADCFIGNQSCGYAIAEGLKKPALLEVFSGLPNCLFWRPNVEHGWDESARLPEVVRTGTRARSLAGAR